MEASEDKSNHPGIVVPQETLQKNVKKDGTFSGCTNGDREYDNGGDSYADPFEGMKIDSHDVLHKVVGRTKCPGCHASRKWFCYSCFRLVSELEGKVPSVKLPVKVDIIKHPRELEGKSTAVHAAVIANDDVKVHIYPCIPEFEEDLEKVLLVFPSSSAIPLEEYAKKHRRNEDSHDEDGPRLKRPKHDGKYGTTVNRVIFIDSTWNQTSSIYRDDRLQGLQCVVLKSVKTSFWRKQEKKPDTYLATIEAIYHFLVEYHQLFIDSEYDGRYDNLLYFYSFLHKIVQQNMKERILQGTFKPRVKTPKTKR
ncbi:tRNA-uridine aminocarboxypropyltransferase 1-like [Ptychodera flava]|uniref:tRNA-uridine aminocarboxypropyltransferase 1-like n=1 Tax=Ptychodera flava TaxID=63121 RepID=UPI003969F071